MRLAARRGTHAKVYHRVFTVRSISYASRLRIYVLTSPLVAQLHDLSDGFFATTNAVSGIDWPAVSATGTPGCFFGESVSKRQESLHVSRFRSG